MKRKVGARNYGGFSMTVVATTLLLLAIVNHTAVGVSVSSSSAAGWRYIIAHEIIGSLESNISHYQIKIVVRYGAGANHGETFYCNYNCKPDFGDVRFAVLIDRAFQFLPYWAEEVVRENYAVFWVRVPHIPRYPMSATIYVLYGNPEARYSGSLRDTFADGDDFSANTLGRYISVGGSWVVDVSKGMLKSLSAAPRGGFLISLLPTGIARAYALRARVYVNSSDVSVGFFWVSKQSPYPSDEFDLEGYSANYHPRDARWSLLRVHYVHVVDGVLRKGWMALSHLPSPTSGWYVVEIAVTSDKIIVRRNDVVDTEVEDLSHPTLYGVGFRQRSNSSLAVDWWVLREYVRQEPIHGSWYLPAQWASGPTVTVEKFATITITTIATTTVIATGTRTITRETTQTRTFVSVAYLTVTREVLSTNTITIPRTYTVTSSRAFSTTKLWLIVIGMVVIAMSILLLAAAAGSARRVSKTP